MKRNEIMALIATTILMFAVCLSASAQSQDKKKVVTKKKQPEVVVICPERPMPLTNDTTSCLDEGMSYSYSLSNQAFSILYNKVKKASFDDNKLDLIEVASLGCYYSCSQTVRMMKIFTFADERLKVLNLMAPRIVDPQNAIDIYKLFSFDSDKDKAGEIMRRCRL